jgi:DNA-directed RNA polymerase specialized sigma24 family protein
VTVASGAEVDSQAAYEAFALVAQPRLERALAARFGAQVGLEACAYAMAYGWEHWQRVGRMANPVGYLFRVGETSARRQHRRGRLVVLPPEAPYVMGDPEPQLASALASLKPDQRVAVLLVHGYGWSYAEAAEMLDVPLTTVRNHLHRGIRHLRRTLGA